MSTSELSESDRRSLDIALTILKDEEVVPEERMVEVVRAACDMATRIHRLPPPDQARVLRELQTRCSVLMPAGTFLDDDAGHVAWLPERRHEIEWRFWDRYRRFLLEQQSLPPNVIRTLDRDTDSILERLEDPQRAGQWDRRGMVVGHVQSGKTANYIGLACKAADAGYRLIVVLTGVHNSLRSQTQRRFDEGFLGFDTAGRRGFHEASVRIGVGKQGGVPVVAHWATTSDDKGDFSRPVADNWGVQLHGANPVLLVVKKQKGILQNLSSWASMAGELNANDGMRAVRGVPLLVIDDEADFASINTKTVPRDENGNVIEDHDITAINEQIRMLLRSFDQSAYVAYTATPFANIFIDPDAQHDRAGQELFPKSFVINLQPPTNHIGPALVFGITADDQSGLASRPSLPIVRPVTDYTTWMPDKHRKGFVPSDPIPESLRHAIRGFVLSCAARIARGQEKSHNSMLVHVTRFTDVQKRVAEQVEEELHFILNRLEYGEGGAPVTLLGQLERQWTEDFEPTTAAIIDADGPGREGVTRLRWADVSPHLRRTASRITMKVVNGSAKDVLDYWNASTGISVIVIGGDKLSRGLTLEGLSVSYFLRASRMYDTLMQMGRWFGYRPGYLDLCRLYTSPDLIDWYRHITLASEELRSEFDHMASTGATPEDYGLRVRTHPDGLIITALNKMRSGTPMRLSFSGDVSETVVFDTDPTVMRANFDACERLIEGIGAPRDEDNLIRWTGVSGERVAEFLSRVQTCRDVPKVNAKLLERYVRTQLQQGELSTWTVVVLSPRGGTPGTVASHGVRLVERSRRQERNGVHIPEVLGRFSIGRLVSPADEAIDLTEAQESAALQRTREAWSARPARRGEREPEGPSGRCLRDVRSPQQGLLLLYLIDPGKTDLSVPPPPGSPPFVGIGISFPGSRSAASIEYRVNKVYQELEFE